MVPIKAICSIKASSRRIWCIAWSHSGNILASCGEDRSLNFWSVASDQAWDCKLSLPNCHRRSIRYITWSPCDHYLASASFDGCVIIWKLTNKDCTSLEVEALATLEGHTSEVKCVAWSASGRLLATCGRDKSVWFWEFDEEEDVQCVSVLQPHSQDVKCVAWHPSEEVLVSCSYDNTINIYREELDDWVVAVRLSGHNSTVWKVAFSPNGDIIGSCSDDQSIKLWTSLAGSDKFQGCNWICLATLSGYHTGTIFDLSWSMDGRMLATCGADNRLCIFRLPCTELVTVSSGRPELAGPVALLAHIPSAHLEDINSVRWHPSGPKCETESGGIAKLCTAADDGLLNLWSLSVDDEDIG